MTLAGFDALSGIDVTYYSVDGGPAQLYSGPFDHGLKGEHTITFWSVDRAGNVEDATADGHSLTLKIDGTPPTISGTATTAPNENGWYNGDVTIAFTCSDAESGIAGCEDPITLSNEGEDQSVTGQAVDNAGNSSSATVSGINVDRTPPSTTASYPGPSPSGWYTVPFTVTLNTGKDLSGIDATFYRIDAGDTQTYSNPFDFGQNGTHTIAYWSTDKAGNTESENSFEVKVDAELPAIDGAADPAPNAAGWNNDDVAVTFTCSDAVSGIETCTGDTTLGGEGANQTVIGAAEDVAS